MGSCHYEKQKGPVNDLMSLICIPTGKYGKREQPNFLLPHLQNICCIRKKEKKNIDFLQKDLFYSFKNQEPGIF